MQVSILLLAGGTGSRFGSTIAKQYVNLKGVPVLVHCLRSLGLEPRIHSVLPVLAAGDSNFSAAVAGLQFPFHLLTPVTGGCVRAKSMANGLAALPPEVEWVAVHDAARPLPSKRLLTDLFDAAEQYGAAIPGLPVSDTIKQIDAYGKVVNTLERMDLRAVQTPQVARRGWFEQAVDACSGRLEQFTDDAALLEAAGFDVHVSRGELLNRKITTPEDIQWLENYFSLGKDR